MTRSRAFLHSLTVCIALTLATPARASDARDVNAKVQQWMADMNSGNMRAFYAACAPRVAIVDGFPPYAWQSCQDWMRDYDANNRRTNAARGQLSIGEPLWTDVNGDRAYVTYAATFRNVQAGQAMTYNGLWAVTLTRTRRGWLINGSGSAWRAD